MSSTGRLLVACCVAAVAAALFPQQLLKLPIENGWTGAVAMSSDYYVTSVPDAQGNGIVNVYSRASGFLYSLYSREAADQFGYALALDGDDLLVGAPGTNFFAGAVHHFSISTGKLVRTFKAEVESGFFGSSLAACGGGSRLLIGAPDEPNGDVPDYDDYVGSAEAMAYDDDFYDGWWYGAAYLYDLKTGQRLLRLTDRHGKEPVEIGIDRADFRFNWDAQHHTMIVPFQVQSGGNQFTLRAAVTAPIDNSGVWNVAVTRGDQVIDPIILSTPGAPGDTSKHQRQVWVVREVIVPSLLAMDGIEFGASGTPHVGLSRRDSLVTAGDSTTIVSTFRIFPTVIEGDTSRMAAATLRAADHLRLGAAKAQMKTEKWG